MARFGHAARRRGTRRPVLVAVAPCLIFFAMPATPVEETALSTRDHVLPLARGCAGRSVELVSTGAIRAHWGAGASPATIQGRSGVYCSRVARVRVSSRFADVSACVCACRVIAEAAEDATSLVPGRAGAGRAMGLREGKSEKGPVRSGKGPHAKVGKRRTGAGGGAAAGKQERSRVGKCPVADCTRQSVYGPRGAAKPVWW